LALSSSTGKQVDDFRSVTGAQYPIYATDETTLKTVMRSDVGLIMLYDGTIVGLWSGYDIPDPAFFKGNTFGKQLKALDADDSNNKVYLLGACLLLFGFLLMLLRKI
jgi:triosephosphate isomerase